MGDAMASGANPGTTYTITTGDPGIYHEDRVVVTPVGVTTITQMFRVYGATLTDSGWTFNPASLSRAFATVQNPDGSIHYFTYSGSSPWPTSAWQGSGNNAVYNAVDFGLVSGTDQSQTQRAANVAAIQNAVDAAIALIDENTGGGTVVIPAGTYELGGTTGGLPATITMDGVTGGLTIRGESAGTTLMQYGTPPSGTGSYLAADIFYVTNSGSPNNWGIRFRDLFFRYDQGLSGTGAAIDLEGGVAFTAAEDCGFLDCPQALFTSSEDPVDGILRCGLINCWVNQTKYGSSTQITLNGPECFVINCDIALGATLSDCTGIAIMGSSLAVGCHIYGCHISAFSTGISIDSGHDIYITDCQIDDDEIGLIIQPASTGKTYGVYVSSTTFQAPTSPQVQASGVVIDTSGTGVIEGVFLQDCMSYGFENAGVNIVSGKAITISGGKYSSNGSSPLTPSLGAGIAVTGAASQVRIIGADCSGVYDFVGTTQPYGVAVSGSPSDVLVTGCDLTANGTGPLYASSPGTLEVTNCMGYNDQGTVLQSTPPQPSGTFYNYSSWPNVAQGWYGPVTFYVKGAGAVTIDSNDTYLTDGAYTISPGESASIAGTATRFLAIGK